MQKENFEKLYFFGYYLRKNIHHRRVFIWFILLNNIRFNWKCFCNVLSLLRNVSRFLTVHSLLIWNEKVFTWTHKIGLKETNICYINSLFFKLETDNSFSFCVSVNLTAKCCPNFGYYNEKMFSKNGKFHNVKICEN